jgi:hypothetical protein
MKSTVARTGREPRIGLRKLRHAGPDRGTRGAQPDQERAGVVQHEMLRAVDEEHVLRIIIDMGLQHDIERDDAQHECDIAPDRRPRRTRKPRQAAREPCQRKNRRKIFGP